MEQKNVTVQQFVKVVNELTEITLVEVKARESQVARLANDVADLRNKIELIERFLSEGYSKFKDNQPKSE